MKKLLVAIAMMASALGYADSEGTVDEYQFTSTMHVYSLKHAKYVTTRLNGTLTVDNESGTAELAVIKKDTNEAFVMEPAGLGGGSVQMVTNMVDEVTTNDVGVVTTNQVPKVTAVTDDGESALAIITGKKTTVGASIIKFSDNESLELILSGDGTAKTKTTGCGPCGDFVTCTKIKTIRGAYVGMYECGCSNGQHYLYDGNCELPEEKEETRCPVWGTWSATLKKVNGAKYK